jgi:hypothetical protein
MLTETRLQSIARLIDPHAPGFGSPLRSRPGSVQAQAPKILTICKTIFRFVSDLTGFVGLYIVRMCFLAERFIPEMRTLA